MYAEGEFGEGFVALKLGIPWLSDKYNVTENLMKEELPLLNTLNRIIFKKENPAFSVKTLAAQLGY